MSVDYDKVLARANELYEQRKGFEWDGYTAPESRPQIRSDQVKAIGQAVLEEVERLLEVHRDENH